MEIENVFTMDSAPFFHRIHKDLLKCCEAYDTPCGFTRPCSINNNYEILFETGLSELWATVLIAFKSDELLSV